MDYILQLLSRQPLHPTSSSTSAGPAWKPPANSADGGVDWTDPDPPGRAFLGGERNSLLACDEALAADCVAATEASDTHSNSNSAITASFRVRFRQNEPMTCRQVPVGSDVATAGDSDRLREGGCWCFKFGWRRTAAAAGCRGKKLGADSLQCGSTAGGSRAKLPRLGSGAITKVRLKMEESGD